MIFYDLRNYPTITVWFNNDARKKCRLPGPIQIEACCVTTGSWEKLNNNAEMFIIVIRVFYAGMRHRL